MQQGARGVGIRSRARAFTLVELLVVIGIIAILLAILIPAANGVAEKGRIIKCAAQMKQILVSLTNTAVRNKNMLPASPAGANIDSLVMNNALDGLIAVDNNTRKLTACPSNTSGGISYLYNPHPALVNFTNQSWTNNSAPRWKNLIQHGKGRALILDRLREPTRVSHVFTKTKEGIWNLGFADGSVKTVRSAEVYARLKVAPAMSWTDLNDDIRILELTAQNRDYRIGPGGTIPWGTNTLYPFCTVGEPAPN